jgi:hypothetical protein
METYPELSSGKAINYHFKIHKHDETEITPDAMLEY